MLLNGIYVKEIINKYKWNMFDIFFNVILVLKLLFCVIFKECLCGVIMEYSVYYKI